MPVYYANRAFPNAPAKPLITLPIEPMNRDLKVKVEVKDKRVLSSKIFYVKQVFFSSTSTLTLTCIPRLFRFKTGNYGKNNH
jgi:hypothetical protein